MKKVLALLLIAVMCCGVFAACSSPAAETPSEPTTTEETPATTEDADAASLVSDAFINPTADWGQYNDLITQIKTETDYAKRTELMHKAEDILMSNYCIRHLRQPLPDQVLHVRYHEQRLRHPASEPGLRA